MFSSSQFEPTSGSGFMSSQPSQASEASTAAKGLVPLTVKQIAQSGIVLSYVSLVGIVCDKDDSRATDVGFTLDDGTGRMGCKRWLNETFDAKEMESVRDGTYVRVNGLLKTFKGKKHLDVFSVRPVIDFNEVTFHYIECIHFYSHNSEPQPQFQLGQQVDDVPPSQSHTETSSLNNVASNTDQVLSSQNNDGNGRKNLDDMILDYLKHPACSAREQGMHLNEIAQHSKIPKDKIEGVLEALIREGHIYTTIDEYHFKHVES